MQIPDTIAYAAFSSAICLQAWQVRQIFEIRQELAALRGNKAPRKRSLLLFLSVVLPILLLLCGTGCTALDKAFLQPTATPAQPATGGSTSNAPSQFQLEVRPGITAGLQTASAVATVAGPYAVPIQAALSGVALLLAAYARSRSVAATSAESQLQAVIKGVESIPGTDGKGVKQAIKSVATLLDVQDDLHRTVKEVTTS